MSWFAKLAVQLISALVAEIFKVKRESDIDKVIQKIEEAQDANDVAIRDLGGVIDKLRKHAASDSANPKN